MVHYIHQKYWIQPVIIFLLDGSLWNIWRIFAKQRTMGLDHFWDDILIFMHMRFHKIFNQNFVKLIGIRFMKFLLLKINVYWKIMAKRKNFILLCKQQLWKRGINLQSFCWLKLSSASLLHLQKLKRSSWGSRGTRFNLIAAALD